MLAPENDYNLEEDKAASPVEPADKTNPLDAFLPVQKDPNTPKRNLVKYTFKEAD